MSSSRYRLSRKVIDDIALLIRGGAYPHVAAESAGIPRAVFDHWMKSGARQHPPKLQRQLHEEVLKAQAVARIKAELTLHADRPLDWLRCGPGKPSASRRGWTSPARADRGKSSTSAAAPPLLGDTVRELIRLLLQVLEPFPDARAAAAAVLASLDLPPSRPARKNGAP